MNQNEKTIKGLKLDGGFELKIREAFSKISLENKLWVACSGGGDSIALAYLSDYIAGERLKGLVYFDHGQRDKEQLAEESLLVESVSRSLGVVFVRGEIINAVSGMSEELLRKKRYEYFDEFALKNKAMILLGHNLDDRIETFMFNLMRGTGTNGLLSIKQSRSSYFRPLLSLTRSEIRKFLDENSIEHKDDPSNLSLNFKRNRIRKTLMPLFGDISGRNYRIFFERLFFSLELDFEALESHDERLLNEVAWLGPTGYTIKLEAFNRIPDHSKRRILRKAAFRSGHNSLSSRQTERLLLLSGGRAGSKVFCSGLRAFRRKGMLIILNKQVTEWK
ncbi:tRNA lysidine(34) synthetase TilS [candidate division WOR-3 bacterium]|nr:tRNA lysidine(34) synthetase TilS [candidate division WOR-3 bacterium]